MEKGDKALRPKRESTQYEKRVKGRLNAARSRRSLKEDPQRLIRQSIPLPLHGRLIARLVLSVLLQGCLQTNRR